MTKYGQSTKEVVGFLVREACGAITEVMLEPEEIKGRFCHEPKDILREVSEHFHQEMGDKREHFCALYFDTRRKVIHSEVISIGTLDSSLVHPREVFRPAVSCGAAAVAVFHNHPSGNPEPSAEDLAITRRLDKAAKNLGFSFLDHLVFGENLRYVSLRERQRAGRLQVELFAD